MPEPVQLNYAPAKRSWRKRIIRIFLAVVLIGITFSAWRWGPYAWQQSQILYWQNRCMNYSASPDTVVYEEDPTAVATLLKESDYSARTLSRLHDPDDTNPARVQIAMLIPSSWHHWRTLSSSPLGDFSFRWINRPNAILFLHERTSPAGHRRLVCLYYHPTEGEFALWFVPGFDCETYVAPSPSWGKSTLPVTQYYAYSLPGGWAVQPRVRIFAGQPDPKDQSRFTVRYQVWGQEDVLDGQLLDNDYVALKRRQTLREPRQ